MNKYLEVIISILMMLLIKCGVAQNDIAFSKYIDSQGVLNPAFSGTKNAANGLLVYRDQWMGIEGAPISCAININTPLKKQKMGIGLTVLSEKIGMRTQTDINLSYSYITRINSKSHFSLGLRGGVRNYYFAKTKAKLNNMDDPFFYGSNESYLLPDFGFGMYYYTKKYFAGLILPNLLNSGLGISSTNLVTKNFSYKEQHIYLYTGGFFKVSNNLLLRPSLLCNYIFGAPLQFCINSELLYKEMVGLGLGVRSGESLNVLASIKVNNSMKLGYSYDILFNELQKYSKGTHELTIIFNILEEKNVASMIESSNYFRSK